MARWQFNRPKLAPTLATLILLPALIALGVWQLHRADYKYALRAQREHNAERPPVALRADMSDTEAALNRKLRVRGSFDSQHQLLLDNRKYQGQPGYYVFTPLRIAGTHLAVLVNRGWVTQGPSRQALPPLPAAAGQITLVGSVDTPPNVGLRLGTPGEGYTAWPKVVQYVDLHWLGKEVGYSFLPYVLLQRDGKKYGLVRDWADYQQGHELMPPEKHIGYAVQWFALALVLVIIYISVHLRRREST